MVIRPVEPRPAGSRDLHLEVPASGRGLELVDGARRHDAAPADDHDVLADLLDEVQLVGAEHDAHAGGRALAEHLGHGGDPERVEAGEGLVEHQELRVVDQRRGELDALLVAVGQVLELGLGAIREPEPLQPGTAAGACVAPAEPVVLAEVGELLCHAHPGVQATLLGHVAEAQARLRIDGGAVPAHVAAVRRGQAEHAAHHRRLAGPVRAQEADEVDHGGP